MLISQLLTKKEIQKVNSLRKVARSQKELKPKPKPKPKPVKKKVHEKLSNRDWEEIMGVGRQVLKRETGAMKRR